MRSIRCALIRVHVSLQLLYLTYSGEKFPYSPFLGLSRGHNEHFTILCARSNRAIVARNDKDRVYVSVLIGSMTFTLPLVTFPERVNGYAVALIWCGLLFIVRILFLVSFILTIDIEKHLKFLFHVKFKIFMRAKDWEKRCL